MNPIQKKILKALDNLTIQQAVYNLLLALDTIERDANHPDVTEVVLRMLEHQVLDLKIKLEINAE